jgi:hypothetical protein
MNFELVFFTDISCNKTGDSLIPYAVLFLRLSSLPQPTSFKIQELDCTDLNSVLNADADVKYFINAT